MSFQLSEQFLSHLDSFASTILNSLTPEALDSFLATLLRGYFTKLLVNNPHFNFSDLNTIDTLIGNFLSKLTDQEFIDTLLNDLSVSNNPMLDDFDLEEYVSDRQ